MKIGTTTMKNSMEVPHKTKNSITISSSNPTPGHLLEETKKISREVIEDNIRDNKRIDYNNIKNNVREVLGKFFYQETGTKPMIITVVQEL